MQTFCIVLIFVCFSLATVWLIASVVLLPKKLNTALSEISEIEEAEHRKSYLLKKNIEDASTIAMLSSAVSIFAWFGINGTNDVILTIIPCVIALLVVVGLSILLVRYYFHIKNKFTIEIKGSKGEIIRASIALSLIYALLPALTGYIIAILCVA